MMKKKKKKKEEKSRRIPFNVFVIVLNKNSNLKLGVSVSPVLNGVGSSQSGGEMKQDASNARVARVR